MNVHKILDPGSSESEAIRQRYLKLDTATVADVLDTLGYLHQGLAPAFAPYPVDAGRLAGWAYTICGEMRPYAGGGDPDKMKAVDELKPGCVSVWSGSGEGVCFFGELIALGMKQRGCTGALVDGGIRDIEWIAKQKFPVYARYRTPVQSIGRWKVTAWQVPAYLPGATKQHVIVNPGDFVLADVDGVIVVPYDEVEKVLNEAERLTATEVQIRAELAAGATLEQVLAKYGHV
ncbi:MAG: RraA family protein [Betaproteobacteria bacterium]|nr:RraA family protein [Betaproteobacteria bacterium]